jgi:hypothetical protein
MAPTYEWREDTGSGNAQTNTPEKAAAFHEAAKTCAPELLEELGYTYLYVDSFWPQRLEETCLARNHLELVFGEPDASTTPRIYKIER